MGLTLFHVVYPRYFPHSILSVPQNIVMDVNNVLLGIDCIETLRCGSLVVETLNLDDLTWEEGGEGSKVLLWTVAT